MRRDPHGSSKVCDKKQICMNRGIVLYHHTLARKGKAMRWHKEMVCSVRVRVGVGVCVGPIVAALVDEEATVHGHCRSGSANHVVVHVHHLLVDAEAAKVDAARLLLLVVRVALGVSRGVS